MPAHIEPLIRKTDVPYDLFRDKWGVPELTDQEIDTILSQCVEMDVELSLALSVMEHESHFDRDAVGPDGKDIGFFQLRKSNHKWLREAVGEDPNDPIGNIRCGIWLLRYDLDLAGGNPRVALTIYRWGHDSGNYAYADAILAGTEKYT